MFYLIDDIDKNGNIIEEINECRVIKMKENNPLTKILKLLNVDE